MEMQARVLANRELGGNFRSLDNSTEPDQAAVQHHV